MSLILGSVTVPTALLIAAAVLVLAVVVGLLLRWHDGRTRAGGTQRVRAHDVPGGLAAGATLVQFSTVFCARCPPVRRMLRAIVARRVDVTHAEVDLTDRHDLASRYRVHRTPTTLLVDASGSVISRWGGAPDPSTVDAALDALLTLQENR